MGIILTDKTADYSGYSSAKILFPVQDDLLYLNIFGGSDSLTGRNLALGRDAAVVQGAPTVGASYIDCVPGSDYLDLGFTRGDSMSWVVVASPLQDTIQAPILVRFKCSRRWL